ncbi:unnamed protein product [Gongylonema pulchrum]|uniref:4-hydroxybenzoate polyprenyltransferase, mitochondrial n=1 Tax=Gongylonema pulchrum TaxID=637853 RepID=A0A183E2R5_9BILA|nr:unnamed protein product [Gongylonema pulchrum]
MNKFCIQRVLHFRKRTLLVPILPKRQKGAFSGAALVQATPRSIQPYLRLMRVDKPTGLFTGLLPDPKMLALFGAGAFLMRSAGCIVNDIFDKDFDKMVERTRSRPLASGELTDRDAIMLLSVLLSASLGILLQFNWLRFVPFDRIQAWVCPLFHSGDSPGIYTAIRI